MLVHYAEVIVKHGPFVSFNRTEIKFLDTPSDNGTRQIALDSVTFILGRPKIFIGSHICH